MCHIIVGKAIIINNPQFSMFMRYEPLIYGWGCNCCFTNTIILSSLIITIIQFIYL
jgi:hypothetical protein